MNFSVKKANLKNIIFKIRHRLFLFERRWRCHPFLGRFYPKKAIYRRALAVFLAFLVLVPSVFLVFRPSQASADWFDDNYAYRQNFSFIHNADISTERAVTFSLDTATLISAGVMQADCDDTRFTDTNGKVLRYQLTGTCNNAATTYEVVFPSIINGSNVGIVYYGNPQATSHSENVASVTALTPSGGDPSITTRTNEEKAPSPALSLKFDEATGTTAQDSSSNNNDGAISGATWKTQESCLSGNCLFFDGTDDVVTVTNADAIDLDRRLASGFTIDAWVRVNSDGENSVGQIFNKGANTYLRVTNEGTDGKADLEASLDLATTDASLTITDGIELNKWTHIAVSYTDDSDDEITIYINGINKGSSANGSGAPAADSNNLLIGGATTANFHGFIDEFKIYSFEETASQIKTSAASRIPSVHGISASFGDDQSYLSNGLVGWWKMDDGVNNPCASGVDKACDSSGNGNVGTWTNGVASTSGKFGNGENFDGVNDYTDVGNGTSLSLTGNFTISAWINTRDVSSDVHVIYDAGGGNILYTQWNYLYFQKNSTWETILSSATINTNTWYHIVITKSGTGAGDTKLYINGVQGDNATAIPNLSITANSYIGAEVAPMRYFNGSIDDVRVYTRALSPSEVTRLYDWAPGPAGWWKMDENTGGTVNDSSGNGNTGRISGPGDMANWAYRMPLTVSNSGSNLTDYQASVSANTYPLIAAGKMQSDCDDVRFYDSDNTTPLNYYLDSNCNNPSTGTVFFVKIPSIPSGSKTIYMYYGNTGASAGSNGSNTFEFFDDFDGSSIDGTKWTTSGTAPTVSGSVAYYNFKAGGGERYIQAISTFAAGSINTKIFEGKIKANGETNAANTNILSGLGVGRNNTSFDNRFLVGWEGYNDRYALHSYIGVGGFQSNSISANNDTWYTYYLYVASQSSATGKIGSNSTTASWDIGTPTTYTLRFGGQSGNVYAEYWVDSIRVRQYAATEPTVTAGNETTIPWTPGKFGSALKFDGVDDYVSVATTSSILNFERNNAFSISGWIKTTSNNLSIFSKMANSAPFAGYELRIDASGTLSFFLDNTWFSNTLWVSSAQTVNNGTWRYVTATYDGSSTPAGIKLYIDGVEDGKTTNYNSLTASILNSTSINIGARQTSFYFNGSLDDIRVYDYVRTSKQIISDMNGGHPAVGSPVGSAVAQWNFDEGYGTTAHNSGSCATCSGTLTNMDSPATYGSGWTSNGKFGKALNFDGTNDYVDAGNTPQFNLASGLTLSAWVKKQELSRIESIVSKGPYSLKIGADAKPYMELIAGDETIADTGALGSNTYVYSLAVYNGKLYGGTYNSGTVYRYDSGTWTSTGQLGTNNTVYSLAVYNGKLYGGTNSGYVYRYDDGTWTSVGQLGSMTQVRALAVFDGKLYGGTTNGGVAYVYSYDGSTWTFAGQLGTINTKEMRSLAVYDGKLYGGVNDSSTVAAIYRYDGGTTWTSVGSPAAVQNIYSLAVYDGKLYAGADNSTVYRYDGGTTWSSIGGGASYAYSLAVYNGKLYNGNGNGHVYRYNGGSSWTDLGQLGSQTCVYSLAVYDGKLYAGTYNTGKVYSMGTGLSVYSGTAIGNEFSHISAAYDGATAKIFINGVEKGTRTASVTIGSSTDNLLIGASKGSSQGGNSTNSEEYFSGTLDSVSIYNYALNSQEIKVDYNRGKSVVMGALSTNPDGSATNSAARAYCPPGNSEGNCVAGSDPAPIAHWTIDENTGQSANDISGNANTGTLTNGPAWTPGKIGSALKFDGVNDYIDVGNGTSLSLTGNFTISAWINTRDVSSDVHVIYDAGGGNILYTQWNYLYFQKNSTWETILSSATINTNTWYHIVITKSGTGAGDTKLYINGVQGDNATAIPNLSITANSYIGAEVTPMRYFNGSIDDVRVYNYARTAAQVAWDYNRGRPLGWWKFDEGQGLTAHDASGNAVNGTLTGGPVLGTAQEWAAQGWKYRIPLTVSNSGTALTDYQVTVTINTSTLYTAGHMQIDCDDARFYDSDNTTLYYWIEPDSCNTTSTKFWIKIPSIPSGSKTIYMYYGNTGAAAASDHSTTFVDFVDYDDAAGWLQDSSYGPGTKSNPSGKITNFYSIYGDASLYYHSILHPFTKITIETVIKQYDTSLNDQYLNWIADTGDYITGNMFKTISVDNQVGNGQTVSFNSWYKYIIKIDSTNANGVSWYRYNPDGSLNYSSENGVFDEAGALNQGISYIGMGKGAGGDWGTNADYKYWIVRKYAATEPTVTAGNETAAGGGKFNSALNFDGVDDYVNLGNVTSLNFERTNAFSISGWIKTTSNNLSIFSKMANSAPYAGYELRIDASGKLSLFLNNTWFSNTLLVTGAQTVNNGTWRYVTATYDGSSTPAGIKLYIDGVEDGKTTDYNSLTASIQNSTSVNIGSRQASYYFNGSIDDVRVYNYVLTPSQIKLLYNGDSAVRFGPLTGSP